MNRYFNLEDRFCTAPYGPDHFGRLPSDELNISAEDREILRGLVRQKAEYAYMPQMEENRKLWRATNDLKMIKPPVFVNEICWPELKDEPELILRCTHPFAREIEEALREDLYCVAHGFGNHILEPYMESPLMVYDSGFGIDEDVDTIHTERNSDVVSRHFKPYILDMDDIEKIKTPTVMVDRERTKQYTELMQELFGDILPIREIGARGLWFTPWDYLIRVMGIQNTMENLYDEPEFIEATVKRYVDCAMVRMQRYREEGIWASNNTSCRVGSGGYGITSAIKEPDKGDTNCSTSQMWGCGNAQIFTSVSPAMHWQFSLQYELDWMKEFGLNYYGCCEPLYHKMDQMDKIPNLRKVSMSPWNKLDVAAERCKGKYVMSCKPNPAMFSTGDFNEEAAHKEIEDIIRKTEGCSIEIIMKDISTVDYKPQKLWRWAKVARETIDAMFD